jgi:FemAB-related protein (PEP-CTERM system-associated)
MTKLKGRRRMSTVSDDEWNGFVGAHPGGSFFHLAAWRDVAKDVFGHRTYQLTARRGGAASGVLPLVELRSRLFGHALIANAFCVGGGPLAAETESLHDLLDQADHLGRKLKVDYVELRDTPVAGEGWLAKDDLYANFERPIANSEDENLKQIPRKQRAVVRKAMEAHLSIRIERSTSSFFPLYARTMRDHGTPALPRRFFAKLMEAFGEDCEVLTVCADDRPLASVLSYFHKGRVLPYYTGSQPEARGTGANDLMYWSLMRRAVDRGCTVFDFGRSKVGTGPFSFKRNWGFDPRPIAHQYRLLGVSSLPNVNPTNPRYATMIRLWRRLPISVANSVSPFLSRSLG